jgi:hypothetical protein
MTSGVYLLIALILSAIFLLQLFTSPVVDKSYLYETPFYAEVLVISMAAFLFLVNHTFVAAAVNKEFKSQESELSLHVTRIQAKIARVLVFGDGSISEENMLKSLQLCLTAINNTIVTVKSSDSVNVLAVKYIFDYNPHKIFYILNYHRNADFWDRSFNEFSCIVMHNDGKRDCRHILAVGFKKPHT